jgi:hypothetical protein
MFNSSLEYIWWLQVTRKEEKKKQHPLEQIKILKLLPLSKLNNIIVIIIKALFHQAQAHSFVDRLQNKYEPHSSSQLLWLCPRFQTRLLGDREMRLPWYAKKWRGSSFHQRSHSETKKLYLQVANALDNFQFPFHL